MLSESCKKVISHLMGIYSDNPTPPHEKIAQKGNETEQKVAKRRSRYAIFNK